MKPNPQKNKNSQPLSIGEMLLLLPVILFLLFPLIFFGWLGSTYLPISQTSEFHERELVIRQGSSQCTLDIPAGTLMIKRPQRAAVGSVYHARAEVNLERPMRFTNCTGSIPNWNISLEGQTSLVSSAVKPYTSIREPGFDRTHFSFLWTFTPEETVPQYQSHFWLRAIVTEKDQTVENWNILVRDFPMENIAFFGQTTVIWIVASGFSLVLGILFLIIFIQKRHRRSGNSTKKTE